MSAIIEICFGLMCGSMIGFLILAGGMAGRMKMSIIGAPPSGNPPRGTWRRAGWVHVFDQFERAVRFRFGKLQGESSYGLRFRLPIVDEFVIVDIRDRPENIPGQVCITRDNVSIKVDGVVYWKVFQPTLAVMSVADPATVIRQATESMLRVVVGEYSLDELLQRRDIISNRMEELLDEFSHSIGIDITRVDITDVTIPTDLQRAMAREAEAQREKRARLRKAEGEVEAVKNLAHAAHTLNQNPELLELRRLQAVSELGMEQATLISLLLPYDFGQLGGVPDGSKYTHEDNSNYLKQIGLDSESLKEIVGISEDDSQNLMQEAEQTESAPPSDDLDTES